VVVYLGFFDVLQLEGGDHVECVLQEGHLADCVLESLDLD
jgi:hypothetical protein